MAMVIFALVGFMGSMVYLCKCLGTEPEVNKLEKEELQESKVFKTKSTDDKERIIANKFKSFGDSPKIIKTKNGKLMPNQSSKEGHRFFNKKRFATFGSISPRSLKSKEKKMGKLKKRNDLKKEKKSRWFSFFWRKKEKLQGVDEQKEKKINVEG